MWAKGTASHLPKDLLLWVPTCPSGSATPLSSCVNKVLLEHSMHICLCTASGHFHASQEGPLRSGLWVLHVKSSCALESSQRDLEGSNFSQGRILPPECGHKHRGAVAPYGSPSPKSLLSGSSKLANLCRRLSSLSCRRKREEHLNKTRLLLVTKKGEEMTASTKDICS